MTLMQRIKSKLQRKLAKLRRKLGINSAKVALVAVIPLALTGCQQTPSRSQQLTFDNCQFSVYLATNCPPPSIEIATQAMAIETAGNESQSASASADYSPGRIDATVAE